MIYNIVKSRWIRLEIKEAENEEPLFDEKISYFSLFNNFLIIPGKNEERKIKLDKKEDLLFINWVKKNINF